MLQPVILISLQGQSAVTTRQSYINTSVSFSALIKTPAQCTLSTDSRLDIKWTVIEKSSGDTQRFPQTFSDSAQSYTIPPYILSPGKLYDVQILVNIMVDSSMLESDCGCPRGMLEVNCLYIP